MSNSYPSTPMAKQQDTMVAPRELSPSQRWRASTIEENSMPGSDSPAPNPNQTPGAARFQSTTIAPSPPPNMSTPLQDPTALSSLDTSSRLQASMDNPGGGRSPLSAGLRISTDIIPGCMVTGASATNTARSFGEFAHPPSRSIPITRTPSIKNVLASSLGSSSHIGSLPGSALTSPMLNAMHMSDVTPLPSPLLTSDSPGPWKKLVQRPASRDTNVPSSADSALVTSNGESLSAALASQSKRRAYHTLATNSHEPALASTTVNQEKNAESHRRNRSISEYVPDALPGLKLRHITVSGSHPPNDLATPDSAASDGQLRREPHLAVQRGLASVPQPPTPPASNTGADSSDDSALAITAPSVMAVKPSNKYFDARTRGDAKVRRWRALRLLGEGTFSKVLLATSQPAEKVSMDDINTPGQSMEGVEVQNPEANLDRRTLVAIKICEHGAKGGADEDRVEMSLKRELEIMKSVHHPSLVQLKAWNIEETRAILVLNYCPGGDLFDVASQHKDLLVPSLLRRMFSELVGAVRYLHSAHIVHRDIKLENILVNLTASELAQPMDWAKYPYALVTLTDLGLSRRVTDEQKLTTRCGSDDYAAPEVILGQGYDGRATDAWSLGVVLYALLEARLPFDPHPRMSAAQQAQSRVSHRIARVDYIWIEYWGEEGDHEHDPVKFEERGLTGAFVTTDGLLRRTRNRWTMDQLAEYEWVKGGITVEGGVQFHEEDIPDEVPDIDSSQV